jgi:hypothetical protein
VRTEQRSEVVLFDPSDLSTAYAVAAKHGVEVQEVPRRQFVEPISTVAIFLFGASVAVGAALAALDQLKGGQVFDLRPGVSDEKRFYRDRNLRYGTVVTWHPDGRFRQQFIEPDSLFEKAIRGLQSLFEIPASAEQTQIDLEQILRAIQDQFPDQAAIERRPDPDDTPNE